MTTAEEWRRLSLEERVDRLRIELFTLSGAGDESADDGPSSAG